MRVLTLLLLRLPDEVGLVAIDGIADPVQWSSTHSLPGHSSHISRLPTDEPSHKWHKDWVVNAETTYQIFLEQCIEAGPENCTLADHASTPAKLEQVIEEWIDSLIANPLLVPHGNRPGYFTNGQARCTFPFSLIRAPTPKSSPRYPATLLAALYFPKYWPSYASALSSALEGNATALYNTLVQPIQESSSSDLSRLAVTCMDSPTSEFPTAKELAQDSLDALEGSRFASAASIMEPDGGCQYWPVKPKENFVGPWNATLETPMLIVTNTVSSVVLYVGGLY